ncbi:hypothetical protein [Kineococcus sp. SYSU DK005]|uniref:hypothetical protein n=1 Tax=Kineococcus sp. SYSU DK005 TaxID=3383126 RepID=UPI003D7C5159
MTSAIEHPNRARSTRIPGASTHESRARAAHHPDTHANDTHAPVTQDPDTAAVSALLHTAVTTSGLTQAAFATALGTSAPRLSTYLTGTVSPAARTLLRAHRLAHALAATRERGLMSAPATATAIRHHLRTGDEPWAWRMLLQGRDHLRLLLHHSLAHQAPEAAPEAARGDAGSPGPQPPPLQPPAPQPPAPQPPAPRLLGPQLMGPQPDLLDAWEAAPTSTCHPGFDTLLAALTAHEHHDAGSTPPTWAHPQPLPQPWIPQHPFLSPERVKAQTPPWLRQLNVYVPRRDLITA